MTPLSVPDSRRVVVAPDSFKGSATAQLVAERLAAGLESARPGLDVIQCPVADGGEGTLAAALRAGFTRVPVRATGPTGRPVESAIAVRDGIAVVELADAAGLERLPGGRREPLSATSRGLGDLVRAALDNDCHKIVLAVGGSASTDGGAGMLQALGAELVDADGIAISPGGMGLSQLCRADLGRLDPRLHEVTFVLASDVDNPLLGEAGAARVFAPQKGASDQDVRLLERGLTRWSELVGQEHVGTPGAGAAGGVGFAALAAFGARVRPGIEMVIDLVGLRDKVEGAALVVTGEGMLDGQTARGKAIAGVAGLARAFGVPAVAVCGQVRASAQVLSDLGLDGAYALVGEEPDVARCIADPGPVLERIGRRVALDRL